MTRGHRRVATPPAEAVPSTDLSGADTVAFPVANAGSDIPVSGEGTLIDEPNGGIAHGFNTGETDRSGLSLCSWFKTGLEGDTRTGPRSRGDELSIQE